MLGLLQDVQLKAWNQVVWLEGVGTHLRCSSQNLKGSSTISTTAPTRGTGKVGPGNCLPLGFRLPTTCCHKADSALQARRKPLTHQTYLES